MNYLIYRIVTSQIIRTAAHRVIRLSRARTCGDEVVTLHPVTGGLMPILCDFGYLPSGSGSVLPESVEILSFVAGEEIRIARKH